MALTGLQIQKLLPKTNCKECGSNTCLAFAMKLAAKKAELSECPYASEEAKRVLGAASEPPVRTIGLGPKKSLHIGGETVLYRHEKTFVHQTALAININDTDSMESIDKTVAAVAGYSLYRVGETLTLDLIALTQKGKDTRHFANLARRIWEKAGKPLILRSHDAASIRQAAEVVKGSGSILCAATPEKALELWQTAKECGHALSITAENLDELAVLAGKLKEKGFNDLILQIKTHSPAEQFQANSLARRAALKDGYKPLGYPFLRFIDNPDLLASTGEAITEINKYGSVVVLPRFDAAQLAALMTLRLNIYTDPQKPIQVEPKVYAIGDPTPDSPIFVTTNFSLTYFVVSGEIENSGISAWLVVPECEGMSVLTAWAAGKFNGAVIGKFVKEIGLAEKVRRRELVIPGYVAQISGELEENLPGWKILVGPQEAAEMESFIKARFS